MAYFANGSEGTGFDMECAMNKQDVLDIVETVIAEGMDWIEAERMVEERFTPTNTGSPKLPADIVDLLKRCRTAITPCYENTLLLEDLNDVIGGQLRAGA